MQVQPAIAPSAPPEKISHIERIMQALARRVWQFVEPFFIWLGWAAPPPEESLPLPQEEPPPQIEETAPPPDFSFEIQILSGLRVGSIAPPMVLKHFERYVAPSKQEKIYQQLGQQAPLPVWDRYAVWRSPDFREIGFAQVRINPYLVAPYLEKALQRKIVPLAS